MEALAAARAAGDRIGATTEPVPETLRAFAIPPEVQWIVYGVLMILVLYFLPAGIVPAVRQWWQRRRGDAAAIRAGA